MFFISLSEDHPRIRGKHQNHRKCKLHTRGSPPHTREAPNKSPLCTYFARITPAYAGSTREQILDDVEKRDHPRIRGKHLSVLYGRTFGRGSPPHTREAQYELIFKSPPTGITPAYAGSTMINNPVLAIKKDHPRIRGKHQMNGAVAGVVPGSPPHTREAPEQLKKVSEQLRITPAYAGSTR